MATRPFEKEDDSANDIIHGKWEGLANGDDGAWFSASQFTDVSFTAGDSFGSGTLTMQGTNDPNKTLGLTTIVYAKNGSSATLTAAGGGTLLDSYRFMRPLLAGGTAGDVDVFIKAKRIK